MKSSRASTSSAASVASPPAIAGQRGGAARTSRESKAAQSRANLAQCGCLPVRAVRVTAATVPEVRGVFDRGPTRSSADETPDSLAKVKRSRPRLDPHRSRTRCSALLLSSALACSPAVEAGEGSTSGGTETSSGSTTTEGSSGGSTGTTTEGSSGGSTGTTASGSTTGTTTFDAEPTGLCPGNAASECTVMPSCGPHTPCGHPANYLDEAGCPRPWCSVNQPCERGTRCYFPVECAGVCTDTMVNCGDTLVDGRVACSCGGESICVGFGHCIPEAEWPGCCVLEAADPSECPTPEIPPWP